MYVESVSRGNRKARPDRGQEEERKENDEQGEERLNSPPSSPRFGRFRFNHSVSTFASSASARILSVSIRKNQSFHPSLVRFALRSVHVLARAGSGAMPNDHGEKM